VTFDPMGLQTGGRRAALRAEKQRKQRQRTKLGGGALGLAVLIVLGVVLAGTLGGGHANKKGPTRTQRTLLLQVKGPTGTAIASALLAHDRPSKEGSVVLLPPQVIATVPGSGAMPFGRALQAVSAKGSRDALADLIGVTVDGSWVLDAATFRRLVDQVGGIQVKVDTTVLSGRTVLLSPGPQRIGGALALAFATYLAPREQEQFRLARLESVIDGIVTALPASTQALLTSLGPGSASTFPAKDLAALLLGLKSDDAAEQLQYRSLPVIKVDAGTDDVRFRIDPSGTRSLVDELLAQSVPPGVRAAGNRVLVLNGVGTPGLGDKVRDKLVPAGFVFVGSRNAPSFDYARTQVLVKDATAQGTALGQRVARALGVPASSVMASDQIGTIADVVVIVGRDFKAS
jgi:hypothetical protein